RHPAHRRPPQRPGPPPQSRPTGHSSWPAPPPPPPSRRPASHARCPSVPPQPAPQALRVLFFFQAEDGIRDRNVTGVQTCALPISDAVATFSEWPPPAIRIATRTSAAARAAALTPSSSAPRSRATRSGTGRLVPNRSEERRVGKEGGSGMSVGE